MKTLAEMTHYEVLEVEPDAGPEELERAYRLARATYSENSLALYSVFNEEESSELSRRIELAYQVLADAEQRRAYDASLGSGIAREDDIKIALDLALEDAPAPQDPFEAMREVTEFEAYEEDAEGSYDGAWLRRSRLRSGVEIEQIATVTKINPTYLRFIEEEKFEDLPAPVYVRGFVEAYARCLGLEPDRVVAGYMRRLDQVPRTEPRRRERRERRERRQRRWF
jgi:flagellar biosynthesis protein FlhG